MSTTELALSESGALSSQNILAIDPTKYVALVFEPFREKLTRYKAEADAVTFDVATSAGMKLAIEWRARFRDEIRIESEKARKERKAPILEIGRLLDSRAKEIAAEVAPYEARFDDAIKAHEQKIAREKAAQAEAERARVLAIQTKLAKLQSLPEAYTSALAPVKLAEIITQLESGLTFDYQEFADKAEGLRQAALVALRAAHVEAIEREEREAAEEAARAAEEARLSAERAAEAARIAAEQAAAEERLREERAKLEAEHAAQRRNAEIDQRIRALSGPAHLTATDSPMLIDQVLGQLADAVLTEADYGERLGEAQEARKAGVTRLQALWKAALAHKEEQERLARQRAEQEELARAQAEREAEIARREREQEAAEAERKWLAEQEAKKEAERKAEADRIERERQEREAEQARRRAEIVAQLSKMTAEDIVRWIANELGCEWSIVAARLAEIPRKDWLALTHSPDSGAPPESP